MTKYRVVIGFRSDHWKHLNLAILKRCSDKIWYETYYMNTGYLNQYESVIRPMVQIYSGTHINLDSICDKKVTSQADLPLFFEVSNGDYTDIPSTCQVIADNFVRFIYITSGILPITLS